MLYRKNQCKDCCGPLRRNGKLAFQFKNVRIPILLFQGGNDKVVSVDHSKEFIRISESEDKEFVFYQNMYHIIFEEPEIEEILDKTVKWINARI